MAAAEELRTFLSKRGYDVEVEKKGNAFLVSLHVKSVDEVADLFMEIREPGRFVIAVHHPDIAELVMDAGHIPEQFEEVKEEIRKESVTRIEAFSELATLTQKGFEELKLENRVALSELEASLNDVQGSLSTVIETALGIVNKRLALLERKPWWKRRWWKKLWWRRRHKS